MPLKLIFILLCFVEIYAEFWCTEETLLNLIHCLLSTSISYDPLLTDLKDFKRRFGCAKEADCIRKPWDLMNVKIKLLRKYFWCMINNLHPTTSLAVQVVEEYKCRLDLANNLPADLRVYYYSLVPPKPTTPPPPFPFPT